MSHKISRRRALTRLTALASGVLVAHGSSAQTKIPIAVYKDKSCGCCHQWVEHMKASGFAATVTDTSNLAPIKSRYKVPSKLESCHTAIVGTYVIEGHVPASDVKTLLARKPAGVVGLSIPGMPRSAPGMDLEPFQPYTVLTFDAKGATTVFARHEKA